MGRRHSRTRSKPYEIRTPDPANSPMLVDEARFGYGVLTVAWESLDSKLVALLAYVGVLIAAPLGLPIGWRVAGSAIALAAGVMCVVALWPRDFPVVDAAYLNDKFGKESTEALRVQTLGVLCAANMQVQNKHRTKSTLMAVAGLLVLIATVIYGAGSLADAWGGETHGAGRADNRNDGDRPQRTWVHQEER